jgi:CHAD domain-containing protein
MKTSAETERKYDVPEGFRLPGLAGVEGIDRLGDAATHDLVATYFDTDDLRLAQNRRTLRRRTGGTDAGWHLKTPGDGSTRTEHWMPDAEELPAELASRIRPVVRDRPVCPVATLRTHRVETPLLDEDGRVLALLADDTVDASADGAEQRWREIEVELVDGGSDVLDEVELALLAAGATAAAGSSKLGRVLGGRVPAAPARPTDRVTAYVSAQRDTLLANDPGARDGDEDAVHDMRVSIRRLRSSLRTFREHWDGERADRLRDELKWLADALGAVRDTQVMAGRLVGDEFAEVAHRVRELLAEDLREARAALTAALDDDRYLRLLDELDAVVAATRKAPTRSAARAALARADRRLADAKGPDRDAKLHAARRAYKRARYAVEVYGRKAKPLVKSLTHLQDVLGTHQDAIVTANALRDFAGRTDDDSFPYGVLYARQRDAAEAVLADLQAARREAQRPKNRRWL